MNTGVKELVAGGGAIAGLAGMMSLDMSLAWGLPLSVVIYLGLRMMLPGARNSASPDRVVDPEHAHRQTLLEGTMALSALEGAGNQLQATDFQERVRTLVDSTRTLIDYFSSHPETTHVAKNLPGRLRRIKELIDQYHYLHQHREHSPDAEDALRKTEEVILRANERFCGLLERLLNDDVIELRTNARVYEDMMDLE